MKPNITMIKYKQNVELIESLHKYNHDNCKNVNINNQEYEIIPKTKMNTKLRWWNKYVEKLKI